MNLGELSDADIKVYAKGLKRESREFPAEMTRQPLPAIPETQRQKYPLIEIWRSNEFFVQVFKESETLERLSVNRTAVDITNKRWRDGITWDEIQQIKLEVGRGEFDAVEVFPAEFRKVNVANMRHIWVFRDNEKRPFIWGNKTTGE